jgi:hypothetical protein
MPASAFLVGRGKPLPLGLSRSGDEFNFAVFSRHATGIGLLVFDGPGEQPIETITLDPIGKPQRGYLACPIKCPFSGQELCAAS